ncbi:MAG: AAA family ATPase [Clostridiales bacterium]|nr:AAA family ATPase [Clostridiales bacterium]MDD6935974.1 AAA family ATPase [Clostridiales bacterium]MDY2962255.1 AAA family ATPase [Oscillospiraceae bacterium]
MSKPVVILADPDYMGYLDQLQVKFVEEQMNDIELEVITDPEYFRLYFSTPRRAGVLVVSEEFYHPDLHKHNIQHVFLLSEQPDVAGGTENLSVQKLQKYSSVKSIYNAVVSLCPDIFGTHQTLKTTQVIAVTSPFGGSGKTTTALGISACLAQSYKKVLYVDAEQIQTFQYFLENQGAVPMAAMQKLLNSDEQLYSGLLSYLRKEQFSYLPPFPVALNSAGLEPKHLLEFIRAARESGDYDYVVVDTDSVFDAFKISLFSLADRVILVTEQDAYSVFRTRQYLSNFNYKDSDKYLFICNRYVISEENALLGASQFFSISEYVESRTETITKCKDLTELDGFQKLAYMLS